MFLQSINDQKSKKTATLTRRRDMTVLPVMFLMGTIILWSIRDHKKWEKKAPARWRERKRDQIGVGHRATYPLSKEKIMN